MKLDELEFHLEMLTRRYEAMGLDRAAARARALERLGNVDDVRRECRAIVEDMEANMRRAGWWHGLWQDSTYAARAARKTPLVAATALVTIAIGIGASTAVFSVVSAVLFKSVAYEDAGRLVVVWNSYGQSTQSLDEAAIAAAEFADIRERQRAFDGLAALRPEASSLAGDCGARAACEPERVNAYVVSPSLFEVLRVAPARGRGFAESDGAAGADPVVILGDGLWRRRFGADVSVVGRSVDVGGVSRTVIGVMPEGVRFPDAAVGFLKNPADLWIPFDWTRNRNEYRGNQQLGLIARVRRDVTPDRAQADLDAIAAGFRAEYPKRYAGPGINWRIKAVPLRRQMVGETERPLGVLGAAVGFVLLIACANVANLMLARGATRRRELAVRSTLGASRGRLIRQLLVEAVLFAAIGGALGVLIAVVGVRALTSLDPGNIPYLDRVQIDWGVLGLSASLTAVTAVLIGLVPAIRNSVTDPQLALADGGRTAGTAPLRRSLRSLLVIAEIAMAAVVLVTAGLLVRSFAAMARVPLGFDPAGTAVAQVALPRARYDTGAKILAFQRELLDRLAASPGVTHASAISPLPMSGEGWGGTLIIRGYTPASSEPDPHAAYAVALPNYFQAMGIRLLEGREFSASDTREAPRVAVVDEALARRYWPRESAIGKHLGPYGRPKDDASWTTVIGVVARVRNGSPRVEGEQQVYLAALQNPELSLYYVARTSDQTAALPAALRGAVRDVDRALPVSKLTLTSDLVARVVAPERFTTLLLTLFGAVALVLAVVGLYGVMAFLVVQRTREIGIRLALGGRPRRVLGQLLGEGVTLAVAGILLGLAGAAAMSRAVASLLFGVMPTDPMTYAAIGGLLVLVAVGASYVPTRRALRIDPFEVMKQ